MASPCTPRRRQIDTQTYRAVVQRVRARALGETERTTLTNQLVQCKGHMRTQAERVQSVFGVFLAERRLNFSWRQGRDSNAHTQENNTCSRRRTHTPPTRRYISPRRNNPVQRERLFCVGQASRDIHEYRHRCHRLGAAAAVAIDTRHESAPSCKGREAEFCV